MKRIKFIIIAFIILYTGNLFSQDIGSIMIPFSTYSDKWDHRWYANLPQCEKYKSIEVLSFDNDLFQNTLFILVKLNLIEKEIPDLYFNNPHKAKNWRNEANFASMIYNTNGVPGSPMNLDLSFTDNNGDTISVKFDCSNSEPESDGFADVTNYALRQVLSLVSYEMHCLPKNVSIQIGDYKLGYNSEKDSNSTSKIQAMYSYNNMNFVLRSNDKLVILDDKSVRDKFGYSFDLTDNGNEKILRTKNLSYKKYIVITTDSLNQMKDYTFYNIDEYFRISFDQPLISTKTPDYEQTEKEINITNYFTMSASNTKQLIKGICFSELKPAFIHNEWSFTEPSWITKHRFLTDMMQFTENDYNIKILPLLGEE